MPKVEKLPSIHGVKDPLLRRILRWLMQRVVEPVVPVGATMAWFGSPDSIPPSWVPMDGRLLHSDEFSDLFAVLGYRYGGAVPQRMFAVPDARGRWIYGFSKERADPSPSPEIGHDIGEKFGHTGAALSTGTIGPPANSPFVEGANVVPTRIFFKGRNELSGTDNFLLFRPASITGIWIIKALSGQEAVAGAGPRQSSL